MSQKNFKLRVKKNENVIGGKVSPVVLLKACSICSLLLALGRFECFRLFECLNTYEPR